MTTFTEELALIEPIILQLHQLFIEINERLTQHPEYHPFNTKRTTVKQLMAKAELRQSLIAYLDNLLSDDVLNRRLQSLTETNDPIFRFRVKRIDSLSAKLDWYAQKTGDFPINKSINDLLGTRLVVNSVRQFESELLDYFLGMHDNGIRRGYIRDDRQYHALHLYISDTNNELRWEIQIWDEQDQAANIRAHRQHELAKEGGNRHEI